MDARQLELQAEIEQRHWWFVGRREIILGVLGKVLPPSPDATVIDVGCGTGGNTAALAERYRAVGVDPSPHAIRLARHRFPRARYHRTSPTAPGPRLLRCASAVILTDVIEHIQDDRRYLATLLDPLRPGTLILITAPAGPSLYGRHDRSLGHWRRYTAGSFTALWNGLAVQVRLLSHFNTRLFPILWLIRRFNRAFGRAAGTAGTDLSMPSPPLNRALTRIFAGESRRLIAAIDRPTNARAYSRGLSLIALLERGPAGWSDGG